MRFKLSLRKSPLSWPGKRKLVLVPHITCDTNPFRSSNVGLFVLSVRAVMPYLLDGAWRLDEG